MRVLFASTRGAGHFQPLVPFLDAALRGGHEVLVAGPPPLAYSVTSAGYPYWDVDAPAEEELGPTWGRVQTATTVDEAEEIVVGEIFGRLNSTAALPGLQKACEEWRPDLIVRDPAEYASAVVAESDSIPHTRAAIGLAHTERRMTEVATAALADEHPGLGDAIARSPYLTTWPERVEDPEFTGPTHTRRFRDPSADQPSEPLEDWWPGDERPLVYLSFGSVTGTLPMAPLLYRNALDAMHGVPARVLITVGREVELDGLGPVPGNVHLERWVPQADVFGSAALVVCHGGAGTTLGALAAGLPLVVVPLFADQPPNARRVADSGAGLVVEPARDGPTPALPSSIDPGALREAVVAALSDQGLTRGARAVAEEMRALPPIDGALEALV